MKYKDYIQSAAWKRLAQVVKERDGFRCQVCGGEAAELDVHHKTYKRMGHERLSDLTTLCRTCHAIVTMKDYFDRSGMPFDIPGVDMDELVRITREP